MPRYPSNAHGDPRWFFLLPGVPTNVAGSAGDGQVLLAWTAPSSVAPIIDYIVQLSSDSGTTWTTVMDGLSTSTLATVTGLTNGTSYVFRVAAVSGIGVGAWSAASVAVIAGSDPYFSSVALLLHMDGTNGSTSFPDNSGSPKSVVAAGSAAVSTASSKFGGASVRIPASSYLEVSGSGLAPSGDFALELWANFDANVTSNMLCMVQSLWTSGGWSLWQHINYPGKASFWVWNNSSSVPLMVSTTSFTPGAWTYVAVSRSGNTWNLYFNGTREATVTSSASISQPLLRVGSFRDNSTFSTGSMVGYQDEVRLTLGTARGYTGSSITVPTAPFLNQ